MSLAVYFSVSKKADWHDKCIKLCQYVMKILVDYLGAKHSFAATQKKLHATMTDSRRLIGWHKFLYQVQVLLALSRRRDALGAGDALKGLQAGLTFVEQCSSDLAFLQSKVVPSLPKDWLDFSFPFAKSWGNVCLLLGDLAALLNKRRALLESGGRLSKEKRAALERDCFFHGLAVARETCDVLTYFTWIDNWKRQVSPQLLNWFGLVSALVGLYEMVVPHSHSSIE